MSDYRAAGVDRDRAREALGRIGHWVKSTHGPAVLENEGGFAGLFHMASAQGAPYKDPVLVSGTDGVGTKVILARETGCHEEVGTDLVAMSVNDVVVTGARPLFFLDYIATGKINPDTLEALVRGVSMGCMDAGAALLGGETAEMPDVYSEGDYDLAGFCVGVAEREALLDGSRAEAGDSLVGMPSSGVHSNGFSLVRHILSEKSIALSESVPGEEEALGKVLMRPTRLYVKTVLGLMDELGPDLHALAHITGGGIPENLPRVLPEGVHPVIQRGSWKIPPVFTFLQERGSVAPEEMDRVFNMGIGMIAVVPPHAVVKTQEIVTRSLKLSEPAPVIGELAPGAGEVEVCESYSS